VTGDTVYKLFLHLEEKSNRGNGNGCNQSSGSRSVVLNGERGTSGLIGGVGNEGDKLSEGGVELRDGLIEVQSLSLIVDGSRNDLLAASSLAEQVTGNVGGQVVDVDKVVSGSDGNQVSLGDGNALEVEAFGLVVLSGFGDSSNDDLSVGNSSGLLVSGFRGENVSSNSVVGSDGSFALDVVDNSLNNSGEGSSLDVDILGSSQGHQPGSSELAVLGDVPVDVVEDGGWDLDDVHGGCAVIASEDETIASRSGDGVVGIGSEGSDLVGDRDVVGLSVIKVGKRNN